MFYFSFLFYFSLSPRHRKTQFLGLFEARLIKDFGGEGFEFIGGAMQGCDKHIGEIFIFIEIYNDIYYIIYYIILHYNDILY